MADNGNIEEVFERWAARLRAIDGVMGVAIGLSKDTKQKVIKIYVDRKHIVEATEIPREIEGFSVVIETRPSFRPL